MRCLVDLKIDGIPTHAWDLEIVEELLGKACIVEFIAPETSHHFDLSIFKLSAWCIEPELVPVARQLWVLEPPGVSGSACFSDGRRLLECPTNPPSSTSPKSPTFPGRKLGSAFEFFEQQPERDAGGS